MADETITIASGRRPRNVMTLEGTVIGPEPESSLQPKITVIDADADDGTPKIDQGDRFQLWAFENVRFIEIHKLGNGNELTVIRLDKDQFPPLSDPDLMKQIKLHFGGRVIFMKYRSWTDEEGLDTTSKTEDTKATSDVPATSEADDDASSGTTKRRK